MLQKLGGKAPASQLMKLAFLLRNETSSRGGNTFYRFVPYKTGPHSFTLQKESNPLVRDGFLEVDDSNWILTGTGQAFSITLPKAIEASVTSIISLYSELQNSELSAMVQEKYHWYTVNTPSRSRRKVERPYADEAIYTAGYEKKTVDEFLNLLLEAGIQRLVDVRYNPVSRRYGYHKSTLSKLCISLGIEYRHMPELGIPGEMRGSLTSPDDYNELFAEYRLSLTLKQEDISKLSRVIQDKPSVLVCMEADPAYCHRNVLANHVSGIINLPIIHLGTPIA